MFSFPQPFQRRLLALLLLGCSACQEVAGEPPVITAFAVSPAETSTDQPVQFSWRTSGAASCTLTPESLTPGSLTPSRGTPGGVPVNLDTCAAGSYPHSYAAPGHYLATLAVTSAGGEQVTRRVAVRVLPAAAPTPRFTSRGDGLSVSFDAAASAVPAGSRFSWAFGDGAKGEGVNVTHRYARAGGYPVTLSVTTAQGSASTTETVSVRERITLFDGTGLAAWEPGRSGAAWRLEDDYMEVTPGERVGANDLRTKEAFADFRLHLEFRVPETPSGTSEQARGNSGVYLQGRYEVQVLDSYGQRLSGQNDAGAIYEVSDAAVNASRPAQTWQSYEITFRAARFSGGTKVSPARVSVVWNGVLVQDEVAVGGPTRLGDAEAGGTGPLVGPVVLQDHGDRVRYRNVWLEPLSDPNS